MELVIDRKRKRVESRDGQDTVGVYEVEADNVSVCPPGLTEDQFALLCLRLWCHRVRGLSI